MNPIRLVKRAILRTAVNGFFRPYFALRTAWPVWFYLMNRDGMRRYRKNPGLQDAVIVRLINELKTNGIAITTIGELFGEKNPFTELTRYTEVLLPHAAVDHVKPFLTKLWDYRDCEIDFQNPFVPFALHERALAVVNGYLAMYAKFHYYTLNVTLPVEEGTTPAASQRWHRDPEDKKMCKMFLYLSDVDEEAGPFMYVRKSQYGGKWNGTFPQRPPKGYYPQAGDVEKVIPESYKKICTGRSGTIIFCDTAGLHRGGYAKTKKRLMFTAEYSSKAAFRDMRYRFAGNMRPEDLPLSAAAKFAVDEKMGFLRAANLISNFSMAHYLY